MILLNSVGFATVRNHESVQLLYKSMLTGITPSVTQVSAPTITEFKTNASGSGSDTIGLDSVSMMIIGSPTSTTADYAGGGVGGRQYHYHKLSRMDMHRFMLRRTCRTMHPLTEYQDYHQLRCGAASDDELKFEFMIQTHEDFDSSDPCFVHHSEMVMRGEEYYADTHRLN